MIRAEHLAVSYGDHHVLRDVSLTVQPGQLTALLGTNGTGKTTLLRLLSGVLRPQRGGVWISGPQGEVPLASLPARKVAQLIGVVEQDVQPAFSFTVRQFVALGRSPHLGVLQPPAPADHAAIDGAMATMEIADLAHRDLRSLSSGERQRAHIALALAQSPRILLLDEPTAHLDLHYAAEIFQLLRRLTRAGLAVLVTMHDLNLAAWADRLALLGDGTLRAQGTPDEVLVPELLSAVFRTDVRVLRAPGWDRPLLVPGLLTALP